MVRFTKSIQSFDSRYDEGLAQSGDLEDSFPNFNAQENQGKKTKARKPRQENQGKNHFNGQGTGLNCSACHQPPDFAIQTGPNRGHNGVVGVAADALAFDFTNTRAPSLRDLTDAEKDALEAFLMTLSGAALYTDPKWSDPF